jgi:hypothetical protein
LVQVHVGDGDAEEVDLLSRQFRDELLELDVDAAATAQDGDAPTGAKGDPITIGVLVVTLANSSVLLGLCQFARAWIARDRRRHVTIKNGERSLEITDADPAQQRQLIDAFLRAQPTDADHSGDATTVG